MEKEKVDPNKGDQEGLIEVGWSRFIDKVRSEQKIEGGEEIVCAKICVGRRAGTKAMPVVCGVRRAA